MVTHGSTSWPLFVRRVGSVFLKQLWLLRRSKDINTIKILKNLGPSNSPSLLRFRFFDHPLVVRSRTTDVRVAWNLLYSKEYSPIIPIPRRTVVDCGANIGLFLASLLKEAPGELQRYVAAEPDEESFEILQRQVELCGVEDKVNLYRAAVYDSDTTLSFDDEGPSWGHRLSPNGRKQVQALSLCSLLDRARLAECDLLKVDIEGAEIQLLASIAQWKDRVKAIVCELHEGITYETFADIMRASGFHPYPAGHLFRKLPGAIRADLDPFQSGRSLNHPGRTHPALPS